MTDFAVVGATDDPSGWHIRLLPTGITLCGLLVDPFCDPYPARAPFLNLLTCPTCADVHNTLAPTTEDPDMTTATAPARHTIITTDSLPTFDAVAADLGIELWPVEFRTHEDHIASTDFREWITGVLAAPLASAGDDRIVGDPSEYEQQIVEGGTVRRMSYVGDGDPWVATCAVGDWTSGKRGSRHSAATALRNHYRAKHIVMGTDGAL